MGLAKPSFDNLIIQVDEIVYRDYVDLSNAVVTPKQSSSSTSSPYPFDLERALISVGKKAHDGKLTLKNMAGGLFTISNGGSFSSLLGTLIIGMFQVTVLGCMQSRILRPPRFSGRPRSAIVVAWTRGYCFPRAHGENAQRTCARCCSRSLAWRCLIYVHRIPCHFLDL
ncbi:hypothetical protein PENSPDRAFT_736297 [Peniophora sp. CONT]|nr:hypothetical protein PENSPDRAFT_736297 [Peniophora sp. CONT]